MPTVTVVVPAYNAEKYILQTLDCLAGQTMQDIEAIVVDDGSTDKTAQIVADYAAAHPFVRLVRQENGGVSSARNHGMSEAAGKYILFLDSDDVLTADSLRSFTDAMEQTGADVAIGRLQSFGAVEEKYNGYADALAKCKTIDKFNKNLLWNFLVGNKFYRLETLRRSGVKFPHIGYSEEGAFFMEYILSDAVQSITGTMDACMRYRRHDAAKEASVSQQVSTKLISDFLTAMERIEAAAKRALERENAQKRDAYLQEILYKGDYVLISQFYRLLWQTDAEMLSVIEKGHMHFLQQMNPKTAARVRRLNIDLPHLYFDFDTAANHPQVSVIAEDGACVDSLYMQSMPLFELFVPRSAEVPARWRSCKNLHILPDEGFVRTAKKQKKGRYTLHLCGNCPSDPRILRFMVRLQLPEALKKCCFGLLYRLILTVLHGEKQS